MLLFQMEIILRMRMFRSWFIVGAVCVILRVNPGEAFSDYITRIPNGDKIFHPCDTDLVWYGVGHQEPGGAGALNPFGQDFERLGKVWNRALCNRDSDGDGRTNGQELGDPHCEWTPGLPPRHTAGVSHPGICDSWNSAECKDKNQWLNCIQTKFRCDQIKEQGVKKHILRLPVTSVPDSVTTYMCMKFKLPTDGDYHIIAEEPVIDNDHVVHHMILFGCQDLDERSDTFEPYKCNMSPGSECGDVLSVWTFGSPGHCGSRHAGYRMGTKGYKYAALQVHWNNPKRINNFRDSSGLMIHFTPNLRPHDAGTLTVGQINFQIPPNKERHTVRAFCDHECSSILLTSPIYLIESRNHMHYLGRSESVNLYRNKELIREITNEETYKFDSPKTIKYDTPVKIEPGDELETTCVYQSLGNNFTTKFGEDTTSEMCFAFLSYYPKENLIDNTCLSWRSVQYCKFSGKIKPELKLVRGCNITMLMDLKSEFTSHHLKQVFMHCTDARTCQPSCYKVVKSLLTHPCFQGDLEAFFRDIFHSYYRNIARMFYSKIDVCFDDVRNCPNCILSLNGPGSATTLSSVQQSTKLVPLVPDETRPDRTLSKEEATRPESDPIKVHHGMMSRTNIDVRPGIPPSNSKEEIVQNEIPSNKELNSDNIMTIGNLVNCSVLKTMSKALALLSVTLCLVVSVL